MTTSLPIGWTEQLTQAQELYETVATQLANVEVALMQGRIPEAALDPWQPLIQEWESMTERWMFHELDDAAPAQTWEQQLAAFDAFIQRVRGMLNEDEELYQLVPAIGERRAAQDRLRALISDPEDAVAVLKGCVASLRRCQTYLSGFDSVLAAG